MELLKHFLISYLILSNISLRLILAKRPGVTCSSANITRLRHLRHNVEALIKKSTYVYGLLSTIRSKKYPSILNTMCDLPTGLLHPSSLYRVSIPLSMSESLTRMKNTIRPFLKAAIPTRCFGNKTNNATLKKQLGLLPSLILDALRNLARLGYSGAGVVKYSPTQLKKELTKQVINYMTCANIPVVREDVHFLEYETFLSAADTAWRNMLTDYHTIDQCVKRRERRG